MQTFENTSMLNMSIHSKNYNMNNTSTYNSNNRREFCKEHGEELTYYCFDCLTRCICSECVVHGVHKNHEVMNVKRAYPVIVDKSEELLGGVQQRIQELLSVQQSLEIKKKEVVEGTSGIKNEMKKAFEEIRIKLAKKEKEIIEKAEIFMQEHLQELTTYSRVLQSKVVSLNKLIDNINSNIIRKDEVNMLNFYSENYNRINQTAEMEIPDIPDFNTIFNMKVTVNQTSLESLINNLNGIHMEITSTKGYEINKLSNPQRHAVRRDIYGYQGLNTSNASGTNNKGNPISRNMSPKSHNTSYEFSKLNMVIFKLNVE